VTSLRYAENKNGRRSAVDGEANFKPPFRQAQGPEPACGEPAELSKGRARRERGEFEEKRKSTRRELSVLSALSGYTQPKLGLELWFKKELRAT